MKTSTLFLSIAGALTMSASAAAATADERGSVLSAVKAFHTALAHGDAKAAAMKLMAPDAFILESGYAQTRAVRSNRESLPDALRNGFEKNRQTKRFLIASLPHPPT